MTIIQNQRERAKLFQTYICMPKRLRASKIILDIYLYDERAKRRRASKLFLIVCLYVQRANRKILFSYQLFSTTNDHITLSPNIKIHALYYNKLYIIYIMRLLGVVLYTRPIFLSTT